MKLQIAAWESRSVLVNHLGDCARNALVGGGVEAPNAFYSCSAESGSGVCEVGIVLSNCGIRPSVMLDALSEMLLIGHDESISILDLVCLEIKRVIRLEAPFFEFIVDSLYGQILAIYELGVVALSGRGDVHWEFMTQDILKDWRIESGQLLISVEGKIDLSVFELRNGKECSGA